MGDSESLPPARRTLLATLVAAGGLAALLGLARRRFARKIRGHVDGLYADSEAAADPETDGRFDPADVADLPTPARRYFERVLEPGQPYVRAVQLRQRGSFRLGGADAAWRPLRATQDVTTRPPGFVWDATIDLAPGVAVRAVDLYRNGKGRLEARLFGAVPVASAGPSPEMDEGELLRYLVEAIWVPTGLLPAQGVRWEAVDDGAARAVLEDAGVTASAVFHFGDDDTVERVTARRYRQEDGQEAQWTGTLGDYEPHDGIVVPTEAEVAWNLPSGDLPYWRATIDDVTYRTGDASD